MSIELSGEYHEDCNRLLAEIERLFKLLERMVDQMLPLEEIADLPGYSRVLTAEALKAERDQLKEENESLRKDAERYRWIKKESNLSDYEDCYSLPMVHAWEYKPGPELNEQFASLDAAIDHAISSPENH